MLLQQTFQQYIILKLSLMEKNKRVILSFKCIKFDTWVFVKLLKENFPNFYKEPICYILILLELEQNKKN